MIRSLWVVCAHFSDFYGKDMGVWYKPLPRPNVEYILVKSCMARFVKINVVYLCEMH
jgi:hypothetical protein